MSTVDSCHHREVSKYTFILFGTCSLLSFLPFPLFSLLPFPIGGVSSLQEKQLFPPNSRRNCHTDVSVGGRTSLRVAPRRFAPSLARSLGIPETPQIHAEVTPRLSRGHRRPPLRAFSHFRVGGGRFINVDGPPCFGAGAGMNGRTDGVAFVQ